jgi:AcrR family transcriptional regulator
MTTRPPSGNSKSASDTSERRRPGRPVGQTETRERIVEVAVETFAQHGYSSTSMRKIAGAADVTPPAVTHHFRTKEGLYARVLEEVALSMEMWLFGEDEEPGADAPLLAFARAYFDWLDAHPDYARIIAFELVGSPDFELDAEDSFLAPVLERARGMIAAGQSTGRMPSFDVEMFVLELLSGALHFQEGGAAGRLVGIGDAATLRRRYRASVLAQIARLTP